MRKTCRAALVVAGIGLMVACGGDSATDTTIGVAGYWSTTAGAQNLIHFQLAQTNAAVSGTGTIAVPELAPISGPASPAYTGDDFTITTGTLSGSDVSFTAALGANPDGSGGFFHGTLSFTGTQNGNNMTGTVTYTPPRTSSQIFAGQTVAGATLTRPH